MHEVQEGSFTRRGIGIEIEEDDMGLHMRLARIEAELLEIAKEYDYKDLNFSAEHIARGILRLVIEVDAPGDRSVGLSDVRDKFTYTLTEQRNGKYPTGYAVELLGIYAVEEEDIKECARELGNRAALLLYREI